jgi:GntR family transcriptional regulator
MTSVITTKRAYSELENEGIIVTRPGLGSFVANFTYNDLGAIREESVNECISELISTARLVGISDEKLLDMVKEALKEETRRYERQ